MSKKYFYIAVVTTLVGGAIATFSWLEVPLEQQVPLTTQSKIVELKDGDTYNLVASPVKKEIEGKTYTMLAYNGMIPGPTIKVAQGAEVTINFKNETDLPALLHSHGVRMSNAFDGSQTVQKEMKPGESFSYKLKFPDAGVYWYHPHVAEVYGQGLGLYGAFIVEPKDPAYFPQINREEVLFLSDLPVKDGMIALNKGKPSHSLMGHFGNVMLINGQDDYTLEAKKGEVVRLYVINAANTRTFNFAIKGVQLKLVGGDAGAYEKATWQDSVLLAPSERAIIDVMFTEPTTIVNDTPEGETALGSVSIVAGVPDTSHASQFDQLQSNVATISSIDPLRGHFNKNPDKKIALTIDMMGGSMMSGGHTMMDGTTAGRTMSMGSPKGGIEWEDTNRMMNAMSNPSMVKWHIVDQDTGKQDMDIDWTFNKGEPIQIRIFNDPKAAHPMQHPIHFHGQRFLVVSRDGIPQTNPVWKDTVLVKTGETVDIILDTSNPGTWMAHCHISEHLEAGMMMKFEVK